jgi:hypothetical protein
MSVKKKLTAAKVRAVLRKAGFGCSKWQRRKELGDDWGWTPGYHVTTLVLSGRIEVYAHEKGARHSAMLAQFDKALNAAGMKVEQKGTLLEVTP